MRLFTWTRRNRTTINGVLITISTSLIFYTISEAKGNVFSDYRNIMSQLLQFRTLSGLLTIVSFFILVVFNLIFVIVRSKLSKKALSQEFPVFMKQFTSPQLVGSIGNGCLSWGEGKTVEICNDIVFGWNPENILIEDYENEQYRFMLQRS